DFHVTGVQTCALPIYPRVVDGEGADDVPVARMELEPRPGRIGGEPRPDGVAPMAEQRLAEPHVGHALWRQLALLDPAIALQPKQLGRASRREREDIPT